MDIINEDIEYTYEQKFDIVEDIKTEMPQPEIKQELSQTKSTFTANKKTQN